MKREIDHQVPGGTRPSVSICLATFRRIEGLARTLTSLGNLNLEGVDQPVELVVVDNDSERSAEKVIEEARKHLPWPVSYVVEPRRGISFARNTAIETSRGETIVFIDDDEEATPRWLRELVGIQRREHAFAVTGPVVPLFEEDPPAWIIRGRFFDRPRHPTGTKVKAAGTGNLLLQRDVFAELGDRPFDETMALTGGTDTLLSMRIRDAGYDIVWCDEAVIEEWNPPSRVTFSWLLRRSFRGGTSFARCERTLHSSLQLRVTRLAKGLVRILQGVGVTTLGGLALRRERMVQGMQICALGAGMMTGAVGIQYKEYARAGS